MLKFYCKYLHHESDPKFFFDCLTNTISRNSKFSIGESASVYLVSKNENQQMVPFIFNPELVDGLSEDFYEKILRLVLDSHEKAQNLKTENIDESSDCSLQHDGELEGLIHSVMMGIQYKEFGVLDFVTQMTFRITTKQI
jgi:hypothetical protein